MKARHTGSSPTAKPGRTRPRANVSDGSGPGLAKVMPRNPAARVLGQLGNAFEAAFEVAVPVTDRCRGRQCRKGPTFKPQLRRTFC